MNVNFEYYKIFYHVGKLGSITMAAEEMSISQPAVSQAIKQLENILGTSLFIRTAKGVKFTFEGELLYSYIQRGYEYIRLGERKLMEVLDVEAGELRIGASDMTLQFYLLPYLEQFYEKHPNIKVTVTNAPTPETLKYLQEGKIDFGVVSSPFLIKPELEVTTVREIEDIFIAGKKYGYLQNHVLNYQKLKNLPLICLEKNTSTRKYIDSFLKSNDVEINPEFELATSYIIVQFAVRNFGIASVVKDFAEELLESGDVFKLEFEKNIPSRNLCIVTDKRMPISAAAKALLNSME